jgi:hypothetical protein
MHSLRALALGMLALAGTCEAAGRECAVASGAARTSLLELYTSEGCSSCPPADEWLAGLPRTEFNRERVVPLALHVDYWDHLGWRDPYASRAHSERQRHYARRRGSTVVYTPQFVLNGRDLRGWHRGELAARLRENSAQPAAAALRVTAIPGVAEWRARVEAQVLAASARGPFELYLALFEDDLAGEVTAGENAGRRLRHDFVVRRLIGPRPLPADGRLIVEERIVLGESWNPRNLGLAAFVQEPAGGDVQQAVALSNCR